eukprot:g1870.t1
MRGSTRGLLVLDLDNTVLCRPSKWQNRLRLYVGHENDAGTGTGVILPGCRDALAAARRDWDLVAVTARWGTARCRSNTQAWLAANGVPMPAHFAPYPIPTDVPRAEFKAAVIADLLRARPRDAPAAGVGDRPSDMQAYVQNGLPALMLTDSLGELGPRHAQLLQQTAARLEQCQHRRRQPAQIHFFETAEQLAWTQIAAFLRGLLPSCHVAQE